MLLTINPTTPSLGLTLACGLFIIACGYYVMREPKKKAIVSPSVTRKNCTESYIALLQKINECGTTTGLSEFFDHADEFHSEFQGRVDSKDLKEFYDNICLEIKNRRFELIMSKNKSTVS